MSYSKRIIDSYAILSSQSMASSFESGATSIKYMDRVCLHIQCTGTPTGTLGIQASADGNNWVDMPLGLTALSGSPQDYFIDLQETALPWIRINYVSVSGTGSASATLTARES